MNGRSGDKENPGLPRPAVETPANFPRSTGRPLQLLNYGRRKPVEKGKVSKILHFLIPPRSKIPFENSRKIQKVYIKRFYQKLSESIQGGAAAGVEACQAKRQLELPILSPMGPFQEPRGG
jgi:hypothetical protein